MTGASRALLPSSSNTCNSLSVVLGRPRGVPLREDCNRREKQMQKQAWQAPTSGSSTLAEEPTQHISNTCSSSHKSSDQQQQCSEARPVPSFRACACYQNTFFFSSLLATGTLSCSLPTRTEKMASASPTGPQQQGCKTKKLQHGGANGRRRVGPSFLAAAVGRVRIRASLFWDFFHRNSLHQFRCSGACLRKVFLRRCPQRSIVRVCAALLVSA